MAITGTLGTKALNSNYPVEEGITAETTKQRSSSASLEPEINLTPFDLR